MGRRAVPDIPFHGPGLVERLTEQLKAQKNVANPSAMALALLKARGQVDEKGRLTPAGTTRDNLGADGRAKDRAAKAAGAGGKPQDFHYNPETNRATRQPRTWGR